MEPPDPIPNSEVKRGSADDTAVSGRGKVGRRLIFFALISETLLLLKNCYNCLIKFWNKNVMKTLENAFKEAALAVIAAENGIISSQKLVYVLSEWIEKPGASIRDKLKDVLPPDSIDLLDILGPEKTEENDSPDPVSILIESVQKIREKTVLTVTPFMKSQDSSSEKLVTDESPGRYVIQSEVARGGSGRVLIALDRHLGREIAIKELLLDLRDERDGNKKTDPHTLSMRNRFLREARVTGQLEHPSIVPVYEIGQHPNGVYYYTMRMVKGRTLSKAIKQCSSLSQRMELLPHFYNVCNAVAYAHSKGVLNRDLKPSNVMIGEFGETVVLDWGLAKVKGQHDSGADKIQSGLRLFMNADVGRTVMGFAIGTPSYMPPEQAEGKIDEIDETSDIYSLGAILYQLLTGRVPYKGKSASEILRKVVLADLSPVSDFEPDASPELSAIAEKALSKDKKKRYQSTVELIDEINNYMSGEKISGYKYSFIELVKKFTARNKTAFISSALIFFILIMSTLTVTWYYNREVKAKLSAQNEKAVAQFRAAQAFNEKAIRLELEKRFLSSRIYAAASILYNPANINSPDYDPEHEKKFTEALPLLTDSFSRFYQRHFHRGALFEKGIDSNCAVTAIDVSKNGDKIFAGCENGELRTLDTATMEENIVSKTGSRITGISVLPNGLTVFSSASGNVSVFEENTGKSRMLLKIQGGVECIRSSSHSEAMLLCGRDGVIGISDISGEILTGIKGHKGPVKDALFLEEDTFVVSIGSSDNILKKHDVLKGTARILKFEDELLSTLAVSPDEKTIFVGSDSGTLHVVDSETLQLKKTLKAHIGKVTGISFHPDESMFLSSETQKKVIVWDMIRYEPLFTVEGHKHSISSAMFDRSGNHIVSAGLDGFIRMWKLHGRTQTPSFSVESPSINGVAFAGYDWIGLFSRTEQIDFFNLKNGDHFSFDGHSETIFDIAVSIDGLMGAVAGWNTLITVFDIAKKRILFTLKGNRNAVTSIRFSNDRKYLVSGGRDGSVRTWSLENGTPTGVWNCDSGAVKNIDISKDGKTVVAICEDDGVYLLSTPELKFSKHIRIDGYRVNTVNFIPDNRKLLAGTDKGVFILDLEKESKEILSGYTGTVTKTAFSGDGHYFASSGSDSSVRIWDFEKLQPLLTINTNRNPGCLVFAPDNRAIAVCDGNTVRIWPLEFIEFDKDPLELLRKMEKDAAMKLKDFYLEPGI